MKTMLKYLKEEPYYTDLYDLLTIKYCLQTIESLIKVFKEKSNAKELEQFSAKEKEGQFKSVLKMDLFCIKGERYKEKQPIVREWMDRDRGLDEKLASAQEPRDTVCRGCGNDMEVVLKDLHDDRVLFLFECPVCKKRTGLYDTGEPFEPRSEFCPKCKKEIKVSCVNKDVILEWRTHCKACGYKEVEIDDFGKDKAARLARETSERELLKKHRAEFCLSDAEGQEYIDSMNRIKLLAEYIEKAEKKKSDPDYKKIASIRRLGAVELEKLLTEILDKQKYTRLMLEKPEINRHVIVPFTVQDADAGRGEAESIRQFHKAIKKTLENTNWRLMSEGVQFRLGYLSGRLKGYEQEEDLLQLVKIDKAPTS